MSLSDNFTEAEQEEIIASAMERLNLSRAQTVRLLETERRTKRNPLLERQWVRNLHLACEALREHASHSRGLFALAFWIGLYGVLTEVRTRYREMPELLRLLREEGKEHPYIAASSRVFDACEAARASFSEEELVFVTFMRQIHAHVYQDGFEYAVERKNPEKNQPGTIRDKQMIPLLQRHIAVDEAHRILDEISAKNGHDQLRVATNFAHKVGPAVEQLREAMEAVDVERERDREASARWRARHARSAG